MHQPYSVREDKQRRLAHFPSQSLGIGLGLGTYGGIPKNARLSVLPVRWDGGYKVRNEVDWKEIRERHI